jgi:hypothetical protein
VKQSYRNLEASLCGTFGGAKQMPKMEDLLVTHTK